MEIFDAIKIIANDSYIRARRPVDYRRMKRALAACGLSDYEQNEVLTMVEYHKSPDEPYAWTQEVA